MNELNINETGRSNLGVFGLDSTYENSELALLMVPWDLTSSYQRGSSESPAKIRAASPQLDLYHPDFPGYWDDGIVAVDLDADLLAKNQALRAAADRVIGAHETGTFSLEDDGIVTALNEVNSGCEDMNKEVYKQAEKAINDNKLIGLVGGDHSCSYPLISALIDYVPSFSILQIDAHMDLRACYQNFEFSHASVMHNVLKHKDIARLVQVGVRDYCAEEAQFVSESKGRVKTYLNQDIQASLFQGKTWDAQCKKIIRNCTDDVYISIDVDGLCPSHSAHSGTPVPGGISYDMLMYLIRELSQSKKRIIGFDVVEANGAPTSIDILSATRLAYMVGGYAWNTHQ